MPNQELGQMSNEDLKRRAREMGIEVNDSMSREELITALNNAEG